MISLSIPTKKKDEVVDITYIIDQQLANQDKNEGICAIFIAHTTCALTTADLDPGTDLDMLDAFRKLLPNIQYRHPHDPEHAPDHILTSMIGTSINIPFQNKSLSLGQWQRVVLVEFDGPRQRKLIITVI